MNQNFIVSIITEKNSDGTVNVKNGFILTPEIKYSGKSTKWYVDTYKQPVTK